ncbi:MAG: FixH family protein [Pseudomonadota bacterium]
MSGRTVLFALVGFFAVVIGVNALMATLAIGTFDGAVEDDAYRSGLDFNDRIASAKAQADMGWTASVNLTPDREIEVFLKDAQSSPLARAQLTGLLWRQTARNMDAPLSFQEREPGQYVASIPIDSIGRYELRFTVRSAQTDVAFKRSIQIGRAS